MKSGGASQKEQVNSSSKCANLIPPLDRKIYLQNRDAPTRLVGK